MTEPLPAAPALAGDDLETWAAVATLLEWLPPALDARLQTEFGLTHFEYGILFALAGTADHALRMSVLAGHANSSLSRLSRAVARLEARGWARRAPDPVDGRFTLAILTEDGLRQHEAATPAHAQNVHALVLDVLTQPQRKQLRAIARRITGAMGTGREWTPGDVDVDPREEGQRRRR